MRLLGRPLAWLAAAVAASLAAPVARAASASLRWTSQAVSAAAQEVLARRGQAPPQCSIITGGYCYIWDCDGSRGGAVAVDCEKGYCFCKEGYCAVDGRCIPNPALVAGIDFSNMAQARIRWVTHPTHCIASYGNATSAVPCELDYQKFIFPDGGTGMVRWANNTDMCLVVADDLVLGLASVVKLARCQASDPTMQFVLPAGGTGQVRWKPAPSRCMSVSILPPAPGMPPPAPGSIPTVGGIVMKDCYGEDSTQIFGLGSDPAPPYMHCTSPGDCVRQKEEKVRSFCATYPQWPICVMLKQCPPGGCNNGICIEGHCQCKTGWSGPVCTDPTPPAIPIGGSFSIYFNGNGTNITFAPSPAAANSSGPAPSPSPNAPAPAPSPGFAPTPGANFYAAPSPGFAPPPLASPAFPPAPSPVAFGGASMPLAPAPAGMR